MLSVMAGPHPRDPFSLPDDGIDYLGATRRSIDGLKIAYSPNLDVFPVDARVQTVIEDAVAAFAATGAIVEEVSLGLAHSQAELCDLWIREVAVLYAQLHATFKQEGVDLLGEHRDELTPEFVELIEIGQSLSAVEYKLDDVVRTEVFDAVQNVFEDYDLLVTPTLAVSAVRQCRRWEYTWTVRSERRKGKPASGLVSHLPVQLYGPSCRLDSGRVHFGRPTHRLTNYRATIR